MIRTKASDDFGHRPVEVGGTWPNRAIVCARCQTRAPKLGPCRAHQLYVRWPCTSAVVLGLAPRLLPV